MRAVNLMVKKEPFTLTLKHFIVQAQVRKQYREYVKCARLLGYQSPVYMEVMEQIRSSFKSNMHLTDEGIIRDRLSEGNHRFKELSTYVSVAAAKPLSSDNLQSEYDLNGPTPVDPNDKSYGARDDVKGRLGVEWPWE